MSGHTVSADISGHMLDLDEDEDLEVFSKNTSLTDEGPVPNSPSSMVNQYRLEDDEDQQDTSAKDLFISVEDPESHITAIETYIMYRVVTKTTRSDFDSSEFEVRRRYQDFLWLRSKLEEIHPTLIVHPLPEKFVMKGMVERFNDDFIETRRKALQRFLSRISEHPVLSHSQHFKVFLTAQLQLLDETFLFSMSYFQACSRMGETMRAMANSVRGVKNRPEEFDVLQDYVENFSNKISSVDKVTQRIIKEQREYLDELRQYSSTYSQWAESEENLCEPLKGVASCAERCCNETEEQIQHLSEVLVPALHEYVLCAETLKAVMRRRDNIQAEFEVKSDTLASRKSDLDALQDEVDELADRMEKSNSALQLDCSRWRNTMRADLKAAFVSSAEKNVEYYEKCLAVWESFLVSQRGESISQRD
ncbi:hypothetical protein OJAV_G00201470 [Oryzias javanicus]|uniref:PX domain-containing protein n=1 Tax=Oryzias javanicus TaxID=123683 RepID=A0A3S2TZG8_ORYJA|nr:hypothetical protein OJAV_G00201470 [Oryzias javanicus]